MPTRYQTPNWLSISGPPESPCFCFVFKKIMRKGKDERATIRVSGCNLHSFFLLAAQIPLMLTWHASRWPDSYPAHIISSYIRMSIPLRRCQPSQTWFSITGTETCCNTLGLSLDPGQNVVDLVLRGLVRVRGDWCRMLAQNDDRQMVQDESLKREQDFPSLQLRIK